MSRSKTQEWILIGCEFAATAISFYITYRIMAGPDGFKQLNMRVAKAAENFWQHSAETCARLADASRKTYEAQRGNITV
jgi:hypothetical protein